MCTTEHLNTVRNTGVGNYKVDAVCAVEEHRRRFERRRDIGRKTKSRREF